MSNSDDLLCIDDDRAGLERWTAIKDAAESVANELFNPVTKLEFDTAVEDFGVALFQAIVERARKAK